MDEFITVEKNEIVKLINSVRQFCNITEIKGFDSIDTILGIEIGLENILQSATASKPKEAKPKEVEKPQQNTTK